MEEVLGEGRATATSLPLELWAYIFSFIPTNELYPQCFIISSLCHAAVTSETQWKDRCVRDLDVSETLPELSWRQTYKGIL